MAIDTEKVQQILIELEKGFWKAAGGNGEYYRMHFADDGLMVLPFTGGILTKTQTIETVKKAGAWGSYSLDNPRLLVISESDVALVYEATGKRSGQPDYRALISSLYHKTGEGWQLTLHQQTPLV